MKKLKLTFAAVLAGLLAECGFTAPAYAEQIAVCAKMELPGKENTLNPYDPPEKQRQDVVNVCEMIEVSDPHHLKDRGPITDFRYDHRAFA